MFKEQNSHSGSASWCRGRRRCPPDTPTPGRTVSSTLRIVTQSSNLWLLAQRRQRLGLSSQAPSGLPGSRPAVTWCLPPRQATSVLSSPPPPWVVRPGDLHQPSLRQLLRKLGHCPDSGTLVLHCSSDLLGMGHLTFCLRVRKSVIAKRCRDWGKDLAGVKDLASTTDSQCQTLKHSRLVPDLAQCGHE